MDLGPTQSMMGGDGRLLRNITILLGLSVVTCLAAVILFQMSSHAPAQAGSQVTMSKPQRLATP